MVSMIRDIVDEHWEQLAKVPPAAADVLGVSELPVPTTYGALSAAIDSAHHRHLLIPIGGNQSVRKGLNGPVLQLRKRILEDEQGRRTYADLSCLQSDLNDVFTTLCADVLLMVETSNDSPLKVLYRVLDRWKALLQNPGPPLGAEQIAGLFAELFVLRRLLELDSSAHRLWRGPFGHRHDFSTDVSALEVKASTRLNGRDVRVHGLDQLEPPVDGVLKLVWVQLTPTSQKGVGVLDLVNKVLELSDDEVAVLGAMAAAGYRAADNEQYRDRNYLVGEERWYAVDDAFPRLTKIDLVAAGVSTRIRDVEYTVDLSEEPPLAMDGPAVQTYLLKMLEESV